MYYCFNQNCNRWGESQRVVMLAVSPMCGYFPRACRGCGKGLYFHDTWNGNRRTHDNGSSCES